MSHKRPSVNPRGVLISPIVSDAEWAGARCGGEPAWNDRKIRGNHKPLGSRWDRVTLFVNIMGPTSTHSQDLAIAHVLLVRGT